MAIVKDQAPTCIKCRNPYIDVTSMDSGPDTNEFLRTCPCDVESKTVKLKRGVAYKQNPQTGEFTEAPPHMSGLKIVSDGSVMGTRVYDADGNDVTRSMCISGIQWQHQTGDIPRAVLTCVLAEIESSNTEAELIKEGTREITTLDDEYRRFEKVEQ